ncbi:dnaJ [Symbiodinium pilosum]|uniref:DnaJ protein n=1 Tax=Symbiodinium pilosum TaxID=2952 RepID=A0A812R1Z8_SYMPI|nr:dnaJ [Symbiodinium pilosum]
MHSLAPPRSFPKRAPCRRRTTGKLPHLPQPRDLSVPPRWQVVAHSHTRQDVFAPSACVGAGASNKLLVPPVEGTLGLREAAHHRRDILWDLDPSAHNDLGAYTWSLEFITCQDEKIQSPYALAYFGADAQEDTNEEEEFVDYGQFTLPEDTIFDEDEFIRPSKARQRTCKEYIVDNSDLQADAPGVAFRFSCRLEDRDDVRPVAQWGTIVTGEDKGDGWIQVGERFLPIEVGGKKVLLERAPSKFRADDRQDDIAEFDEAWASDMDVSLKARMEARRRQRLQQAEQRRAQDKEHGEHEQRSRELLRKHKMLMHELDTWDQVLGLPRSTSPEEIERAYKALCARYHPDKAPQADRAARAALERSMARINEAFSVLSNPKQRWNYDRSLPTPEEKAEATEHLRSVVQPGRELADSGADADFDFSGDGRPFRFCRGKAARVAQLCGSREKVRIAMNQLVGRAPMKLADCSGVIRHVGPMTPFGGLGECGHANCMAHRLRNPEIRAGFRDFVVTSVRDAVRTRTEWWGSGGLRYTSLGSGELLFDLELLERLREEAGVQIAQICLIDNGYRQPSLATRRALREFADWQRASAQMRRAQPCEILVFGHLADYSEASAKGGRAANCHVFVQCDTHWNGCAGDCSRLASRALCKDGVLARLAESTDALHAEMPKGVLVSPFQGDLETPQA